MIASRLKLIRQARSFTLDELSEAMNRTVTKQALSKYETGQDVPSARVLLHLAGALNVSTEYLLNEPACTVETIAYRTKKSVGPKERDRLESMLCYHLEEATRLRELIHPNSTIDVPVREMNATKPEEAENWAVELRKRWNLGNDPLGSVVDVLEDHGVTVCLTVADENFDGLSAVAKRANGSACGAAVLSRQGLTHSRQRLNLAHELGHVVLRPPDGIDEKSEESLAWRFAGAFLAPRESLLADVGEMRRSISLNEMVLLKKRYGMSIQALLMRFKDLGILSAEGTKQAFIAMTKLGYRKVEPEDGAALEEPQWFRRTVLRAVSENLLSSNRASELLGEAVAPSKGRNQFALLLAQMPVEERDSILSSITAGKDDEFDDEWLDAPIQAGAID